jgi:hypothetical protein
MKYKTGWNQNLDEIEWEWKIWTKPPRVLRFKKKP